MTFLFFLAIAVWIIRPSWLMVLWLISIPILAPLLSIYLGIDHPEDIEVFLHTVWGVFQRVFVVIVLYKLFCCKKKIPKGMSVFLIPCGFLCLYFVLHNVVRHFDMVEFYKNVAGACYNFLPILVMVLDERVRPKLSVVFGVLIFIVSIQLVMIPFNLEGVMVYPILYQDHIFLREELGLVSGTFHKANSLADFLSIAYLFVCVDFFSRKSISGRLFALISVVMLTILALTGSKMPIVCSLFILSLCFFYYKRHWVVPIFIGIVGVILFVVLSWESIEKISAEYRGVDRFVSGMTNFIESKKGKSDDDSTISISSALIERYFLESPLIGCAYSYKGDDKAYPLSKIGVTSDLKTLNADATLSLYLVEYGLIGLFLYLWYYYSLINYSVEIVCGDKQKMVAIAIFLFFLVFSVTEMGLFYRPNFFYFYMYIFGVQRDLEEKYYPEIKSSGIPFHSKIKTKR